MLRQRDFRLVFGAASVSLLGDGVVPVALAFAVLDLTGSATDLGIVLACRTVALLGALLVGGVVADRIGRRAVMVAADLARLGVQAPIALLVIGGHATVVELAISQALLGAASGFFSPAASGLMPTVAGANLREANVFLGLSTAAGNIAGPALAGVLVVATNPGVALLIDAGTYGISALLLARVNVPRSPAGPEAVTEPRSFVRELREGFAEVRSRTWLWSSLLVFSLVNLVASGFPVLGALVAKRQLGGAGAWAAILTARAVGGLLGGTTLLRVAPRRPLLVANLVCATTPIPTILLGIPAPVAVLVPMSLLAGVGPTVFNTLWETTVQQHVPERARSRVSSYDWFGSLALQPVGYALVGPLAGAIGDSAALYACGAIELALLGALLTVREVRTLPPEPSAVLCRPDRPL
jgi:MFS family permease